MGILRSFSAIFLFFSFFLISCKSSEVATKEVDSNEIVSKTSKVVTSPGEKYIVAEGEKAASILIEGLDSTESLLQDNLLGKINIINFWAPWCAPCVDEMPSLERVYQKYKDEGLNIIAISIDSQDSIDTLKDFAKEYSLSFPIVKSLDENLNSKFGLRGVPETLFLDNEGKFVLFNDKGTSTEDNMVLSVISDRPWDSEVYLNSIGELLK